MPRPYHRRTGLIYRSGNIGNMPPTPVLDGGHDAPITPRGNRLLLIAAAVIAVIGGGLMLTWALLA